MPSEPHAPLNYYLQLTTEAKPSSPSSTRSRRSSLVKVEAEMEETWKDMEKKRGFICQISPDFFDTNAAIQLWHRAINPYGSGTPAIQLLGG